MLGEHELCSYQGKGSVLVLVINNGEHAVEENTIV